MSDSNRSLALTTACDDLQAQIEAGDRSFRRIDDDLTRLRDALHVTVTQAETLTHLQRHLADLRGNMREQRSALREVRRAAVKLCATIAQARVRMETLLEEKRALEHTHTTLLAEHAHLRKTPGDLPGHEAHNEHLRDHLTELRRFRKRFPTGETSDRDDPNT